MSGIELRAYAKVNRSLLILGRRPDGYHELSTVFQTIDLSDRLVLEPADSLELSVDDPSLTAGPDNLVMAAAALLTGRLNVRRGARMRLEKAIPAGAGLGGGSADAAAALLGLAALWELPVETEDLQEMAALLGSDVPFFLIGGTAHGSGRGERIRPLPDSPPEWLLLLSPPFPLPTPVVYRALGLAPGAALTAGADATNLSAPGPGSFPDRNDLEPAAESLKPEVRELREALLTAGAARARLSGSGSTVFGVFPDRRSALEGAARLSGLPEGTRVRTVPTLTRAEWAKGAAPRRQPED